MSHSYKLLDCVTLVDDLPEFALRAGDVGTIVELWTASTFEVEFSADEGYLAALLTIDADWLRPATEEDFANARVLEPKQLSGQVEPHAAERTKPATRP